MAYKYKKQFGFAQDFFLAVWNTTFVYQNSLCKAIYLPI
jgi:hypothetical protein